MFFANQFLIRKAHLSEQLSAHISEFPKDTHEVAWDAARVLQAIEEQHGILVERAHQLYAFSHLTFQEYLTAKHIVENSYDQTVITKLESCAGNDQWREVLILTASLLGNAQVLFASMQRAMKAAIRAVPGLAHEIENAVQSSPNLSVSVAVPDAQATQVIGCFNGDRTLRAARHESAHDLALQIAASRHYERGNGAAVHRARALAAALSNGESQLSKWLEKNMDSLSRPIALAAYLRINVAYCDCLNVATVRNRASLEDVILKPFLLL